jgi:hypothetical protein
MEYEMVCHLPTPHAGHSHIPIRIRPRPSCARLSPSLGLPEKLPESGGITGGD